MKEPYRSQFIKTKHLIDFHQKEIQILEGQLEDISYNNTIDENKQLKQKQLYIDDFESPLSIIDEGCLSCDNLSIQNLVSDVSALTLQIGLKIDKSDLISQINTSDEGILIQSDKIYFDSNALKNKEEK